MVDNRHIKQKKTWRNI